LSVIEDVEETASKNVAYWRILLKNSPVETSAEC